MKNYPHILSKLYGEPWQVLPLNWSAQSAMVAQEVAQPRQMDDRPKSALPKRPKEDAWGNEIPQMEIREDGLAYIPITGLLVKGAQPIDKLFGWTDYTDIAEDLDRARDAGAIGAVLQVACPGGTVNGTDELGYKIEQLAASGFPIIAHTEELMGSAALKICAACTLIHATPSATVGSIGTLWEIANYVGFYERFGIKIDVFASGEYKGMGHPAKALTPEQSLWVSNQVKEMSDAFKAVMRKHRGTKEEHMQGQTFIGQKALEVGLVDTIVSSEMQTSEILLSIAT